MATRSLLAELIYFGRLKQTSLFLFRLRVRSFNNSPMIHAPSAVVNIATMMMNAYLFRELSVACEETGGQVVDWVTLWAIIITCVGKAIYDLEWNSWFTCEIFLWMNRTTVKSHRCKERKCEESELKSILGISSEFLYIFFQRYALEDKPEECGGEDVAKVAVTHSSLSRFFSPRFFLRLTVFVAPHQAWSVHDFWINGKKAVTKRLRNEEKESLEARRL